MHFCAVQRDIAQLEHAHRARDEQHLNHEVKEVKGARLSWHSVKELRPLKNQVARMQRSEIREGGASELPDSISFYPGYLAERPHQSMSYGTPDQVYRTASGGGARIVGKYIKPEKTNLEIETKKETEIRGSAVPLHVKGYPLKLDALLS